MHELSFWNKSVFVTLTYSDEFLPDNRSLRKKDLQLFFKRLRKNSLQKLKYYACGEYGSKTQRPHYHAIIFGIGSNPKDIELIKNSWRFCDWSNFQTKKAFGTVTYDSCRYVSDYIFKKYNGQKADEEYLSKGLQIPFKISSQGLGLRYCLSDAENLKANMGFTIKGVPVALPRYYVQKLGLELESQQNVNFEKWRNYAKRKNIPLCDIAETQERQAKQRELNTERRTHLAHKGVF